ncbi:RcnB family protein [Phenylobacterium immobile]|uniref:RcnB family protein n=1 Tax=Phenylobacterium immobile TaxID=21 RepID=UPI00159EF428|nr:RcnB family protein [Phenylobacterium immobile]
MMTRNLGKTKIRLGVLAMIAALAVSATATDAAPRNDRGRGPDRDASRYQDRGGRNGDNDRRVGQQGRDQRDYGRPPANVRRGAFLPDDRRGAPVGDYNRARLRPPPQGYGWYRENGRYMLLDQYTGQVLDVVE